MQPEERDAAYLWDMLDAAKAVREFVSSRTYDDYQKDRMLRGAVERHIEIIGEAATNSSIDCFGILNDAGIRRYFELGCEVKGLGRGHVKRIKDTIHAEN